MPHTLDPFEHDLDCPSSLVLVHVRLDDGDDLLDLDLLSEMHALDLGLGFTIQKSSSQAECRS